MKREKFGSRLGFILISAGCAIGLGNVWRFPYITGKYGGAAFVLIYLLFLVLLGLPIMVMEFAVGRGSQASIALSFDRLEPLGTKWHWYKWFGIGGGVSKAGSILTDSVKKYFEHYAFHACRQTKFALAQLGNDAGIYGSACSILGR